jgi:26S proteasome regulatory subunit N5
MSTVLDAKKDFSAELQVLMPESVTMANEVGLEEAISALLLLEKKCRLHNDFLNLKEVCLHMVRLCRGKNDWEKLNSTLAVIAKRRAQSKVAISAIVEEALTYLDTTPTLETKIDLIKTLKDICDGKIYVEAESAKLHLMLALIYEDKGDVASACDMIQDVHVETYGSLSKKEKAEYILEQIRLNLLKKDYVRALIQSRKMNRKVLEEDGFDEVKVKFYNMMIEYHTHDFNAWEISQCYYKIYDTKLTKDVPDAWHSALESCVIFLLTSKYDNHQVDMMHRIKTLKDLEELPIYHAAMVLFTTKEIVPTPFPSQDALEAHACLRKVGGEEAAKSFVDTFHERIVQHNLRVIAGYYRRIKFQRMTEMLGLDLASLERHLGELAASGDAYVKIDRPAGIVAFGEPKQAAVVLSDWASDIGKMLTLMESTCHLINRENMVHKL